MRSRISTLALLAMLFWMGSSLALGGIRAHRTADIVSGKDAEAAEIAVKITKYINDNYSIAEVTVYIDLSGQGGRVHWFADFKDRATLEMFRTRVVNDQGYNDLVATAAELFVSMKNSFYRKLEMPGNQEK